MKILLGNIKRRLKTFFNRVKTFQINTNILTFTLVYSFFTTIIFNTKFFHAVHEIDKSAISVIVSFIIILCIYNILFTLFFQRKLTKFFAIFFLFGNAGTLYFMNTYNVAIDKVMLLNVRETNFNETLELLNIVWFSYLIILGLLPTIIIIKTKINYGKLGKELLYKGISILISFIIAISIILITYKGLSSTTRQNKRLKHILLPFNYLDASFGLLKKQFKQKTYTFEDITTDIVYNRKNSNNKKNLVIFVVGEASRDKNWSLSSYGRDTNRYLENKDLIYYKNFFSCGTSTAISVPCMFSSLSRDDFDIEKRDVYSNLLDFLKKANFYILWRENNSDCKGVCKRHNEEDFTKDKSNKKYCNDKECFDEILLDGLQEKINNLNTENNFIVLHQKGSHGPAYYLRYPTEFKKYEPTCNSEYFNKCKNEEIINSYDNTINYTSYVLNKTIDILKANEDKYNVALIYVSDHGQSLGEKGMYLHGAPYMFSPEEQRHIPFFMWFSNDFKKEFKINEECLKNKSNQEYSHDNIFHSILGLFNIKTKYYNKELDIFYECRDNSILE